MSEYDLAGLPSDLLTSVVEGKRRLKVAAGDGIYLDAWGKQKTASDHSLDHGMFTFEVPSEFWKESINGAEQLSLTYATSVNGELNLTSNGVLNDVVVLDTYRHPRYQPNRGHVYAASIFLPNPEAAGQRDFGLFTPEAGVFFRLRGDGVNWNLYGVTRTTINGVTSDSELLLTDTLPAGFNPAKGNIYDIQAQMRMVGDIGFFIGAKLTKIKAHQNITDNLVIYNPALPLAFGCKNLGADVVIRSGCVDVSSEGGSLDRGFYGSVGIDNDSGQVAISGFNVPVLVMKSNRLFAGKHNTRDIIALLATAYSDQRAIFRVWATRDETAITLNDQSWQSFRDGNIEYLQYDNPNVTTPITFDKTKAQLIFTARVDQDRSYATSALFEGRTDIFQTAGDIFIFTLHRESGTAANVGVTYEFAEEI